MPRQIEASLPGHDLPPVIEVLSKDNLVKGEGRNSEISGDRTGTSMRVCKHAIASETIRKQSEFGPDLSTAM